MTDLNLAITVQVTGGPQISVARTKPIEAYDKVTVIVNPGDTDKTVDIQPGGAAQVGFLLIQSSLYNQDLVSPKLTYKVSDGTTNFPAAGAGLVLGDPQVYIGGAIAAFNLAPRQLKFTNSHTPNPSNPAVNRATIDIFVGRDATP